MNDLHDMPEDENRPDGRDDRPPLDRDQLAVLTREAFEEAWVGYIMSGCPFGAPSVIDPKSVTAVRIWGEAGQWTTRN